MAIGLSRKQNQVIAGGLLEQLERAKNIKRVVVEIQYPTSLTAEAVLQAVMNTPNVLGAMVVDMTMNASPEIVSELRSEIFRLKKRVESLQDTIDMYDERSAERVEKKAELRWICLAEWAKERNIAYSTAWRALQNGEVMGKKLAGGKQRSHWVVAPSTYAPKPKKKAGRKK